MIQKTVSILFNHHIKEQYYRLGFRCSEIAEEAKSGQFVMLREAENRGYFLSRPFSIGNVENDVVEIYYEVIGKGTRSFSRMAKGDFMVVLGPLGNGFTIREDSKANILVAGGIGIAPFPYFASKLLQEDDSKKENVICMGFKSGNRVFLNDFFEKIDFEVKIATDDGSLGYKGFVTELFKSELKRFVNKKTAIYGCGPKPMLKRLAQIANENNVFCELSMEERMACGVGACLVCACRVRDEDGNEDYKMVCKDGPIFNSKEIVFDEN